MDDRGYMQEALQEARKALLLKEVPIGAIVVKDGQIIGRGHNLRETRQDGLAHAEILALQQAAQYLGTWRLNACTLYVTLEPCPMCAGAMLQCRLGRLVYGTTDPKAGAVDSLFDLLRDPRLNHQVEVFHGIEQEACAEILQSFFRQLRRSKKNN
ncbi:MAG: tRNA adenosine(34) deaminase TadA [Clostridia bacterium]|nr:tRNA adenosine(34) deaminase TadA [Clostridia bacterium]